MLNLKQKRKLLRSVDDDDDEDDDDGGDEQELEVAPAENAVHNRDG